MKYCRFQLDNQPLYGLVESVSGQEQITRIFLKPPQNAGGDLEDVPTRRMEHLALAEAELLAPVCPSKIVCVGRNYREHAAELGNEVPTEPLIFLKPPSSLLAPGAQVRRPRIAERVDHEGELGVVIAKKCYQLADDEDVRPYVLGYTCVNDVTARDLQKKDGQWTRAKGMDTFCPVGPVVVTGLDAQALAITCRVNGEQRQHGTTADMIFSIADLIAYASQVMTLEVGDLLVTGTPSGVGPLAAGDSLEIAVAEIGTLRVSVIAAP